MKRHTRYIVLFSAFAIGVGGFVATPALARGKVKPKIITIRPVIENFQLSVVGTYSGTDGFERETGTISIPKLLIQVISSNGKSTVLGTGNARITGTAETLTDPLCKTPANGAAFLQVTVVPMLSSIPPTTRAETQDTAGDELVALVKPPIVKVGEVAFSLIGGVTSPGDGPSVPCGPDPLKLVFTGLYASLTLARSSTTTPFLVFRKTGQTVRATESNGPFTYDFEYTLTKLR